MLWSPRQSRALLELLIPISCHSNLDPRAIKRSWLMRNRRSRTRGAEWMAPAASQRVKQRAKSSSLELVASRLTEGRSGVSGKEELA